MCLVWPEGAEYFAVDWDGVGYYYEEKPEIDYELNLWLGDQIDDFRKYCIFVDMSNVNWKTTLIKRPKNKKNVLPELQWNSFRVPFSVVKSYLE